MEYVNSNTLNTIIAKRNWELTAEAAHRCGHYPQAMSDEILVKNSHTIMGPYIENLDIPIDDVPEYIRDYIKEEDKYAK